MQSAHESENVKKPRFVLDSYALLAYLQDEPAATQIQPLFHQAAAGEADLYVSTINLGELVYIVERRHGSAAREQTLDALLSFPFELVDATLERVLNASHIKARYAISYADAFAVALGQEMDAKLVTGDPEFRCIEPLVPILWLQGRHRTVESHG